MKRTEKDIGKEVECGHSAQSFEAIALNHRCHAPPTDERIPEKNALSALIQFFLKAFLHGPLYQPRSQTWTAKQLASVETVSLQNERFYSWVIFPEASWPVQSRRVTCPLRFKCNFQNNCLCLWNGAGIIVVVEKRLLWKRLQSRKLGMYLDYLCEMENGHHY